MAETCFAVSKSTQKRCGNEATGADPQLCDFHRARLDEAGEILTVEGVIACVQRADPAGELSPLPSPAVETESASWAIPDAPAIEEEAAASPPPPPAGEIPSDGWEPETGGELDELVHAAVAGGPWTEAHGAWFLEATLDRKFRADGKDPLSPASLRRGGDAVAQLLNYYAAQVNPNTPWGALSFFLVMEVAPRYGGDLVARFRPGRSAAPVIEVPQAPTSSPAPAPAAVPSDGWAKRVVA